MPTRETHHFHPRKGEIALPPSLQGKVLTAHQAAELLQVSHDCFRQLVSAGDIPAPLTLSKKIKRWTAKQLLEHLDSLTGHPSE